MLQIFRKHLQNLLLRRASLAWLSFCVLLLCGLPAPAVAQALAVAQAQQPATNASPQASVQPQPAAPQASGNISGTVLFLEGDPVVGARVTLTRPGQTSSKDTVTGEDGQFSFDGVAPGAFQLTFTAEGFATQTVSGELHAQQAYLVPAVTLHLATVVTSITVKTPEEMAEEQVRQLEKQRIFGVIPNYYVSFESDPVALTRKQKFSLAWKSVIDPTTFVGAAAVGGINQAADRFPAYGQGLKGFGKRFGASYADIFDGTVIGSALMPSLLRQDPRYFYKGTGGKGSRILYALSNSIISKGDNGRWQPNYSGIAGGLITGGIANAYYPARNRGVGLVFSTLGFRIAESSFTGLFDEFVSRRITSNVPKPPKPQPLN